MSKQDSIILHTHDLQQIIDALESHQVGSAHIKIIDEAGYIRLRDLSDFSIAQIKKSAPHTKQKSKRRFNGNY